MSPSPGTQRQYWGDSGPSCSELSEQSLEAGGALLTLINDLPEKRESFRHVYPNVVLSSSSIISLGGQLAVS